jgi:hypothetical protein
MTDEQLTAIFVKIDFDADGVISISDFLETIGPRCFPKEGLYFRQDLAHKNRKKQMVLCQVSICTNRPHENGPYCKLHANLVT